MAVTTPVMYKDMYLGSMDTNTADLILKIRDEKVIPALKGMIFKFPPKMVLRSIKEQKSLRNIIKEEGLDYTNYIGELRDYQTVGTAFMYASNRSIIADGVGSGKTAEIGALINFLKQKGELTRFLMAVENSAIGQTVAEMIKFTGLHIISLPSEAPKLRRAIDKVDWNKVDGIVIKHSTLRSDVLSKWLSLNINEDGICRIFNTFILDESSVIKNVGTKTATYTRNICNITPRVHLMNATVFETHIMDIYNQIDLIDPRILPKKWRIEKEFCRYKKIAYWKRVGGKPEINFKRDLQGYKNQDVFKEALKLVYFGRSKKEIGLEKPHIYKIFEVEPTNKQSMALAKKYRHMEVLNCPSLIEDINIPTDRKNVPKIDRLITLVENDFSEDNIMIYCFHNDAQYEIQKELIKIGRKPAVLNGKCSDDEKWDIQSKFNKGEYDVVITNIQKSLNLHGGDVCIFYSILPSSAKFVQTGGRIDRNIDDSVKTFVLMLYRGTDEYKYFADTVKQRAIDSRDLTIDSETIVDYLVNNL